MIEDFLHLRLSAYFDLLDGTRWWCLSVTFWRYTRRLPPVSTPEMPRRAARHDAFAIRRLYRKSAVSISPAHMARDIFRRISFVLLMRSFRRGADKMIYFHRALDAWWFRYWHILPPRARMTTLIFFDSDTFILWVTTIAPALPFFPGRQVSVLKAPLTSVKMTTPPLIADATLSMTPPFLASSWGLYGITYRCRIFASRIARRDISIYWVLFRLSLHAGALHLGSRGR